jgi:hypothetical protein
MNCSWFHYITLVLTSILMPSAWACQTIALSHPLLGSQITDLQPELTWEKKSGANYRVQVVAALPEARVILSIDTITQENRFKLPTAIPSNFAAVKVLVSQNCTKFDMQDVNAQGPAFIVNIRANCSLSAAILQQKNNFLIWNPLPTASKYIVQLFEVRIDSHNEVRSKLLSTSQADAPRWEIPQKEFLDSRSLSSDLMQARVVSVQAVCNGLFGPVEQIALKPAG